MSDVAPNDHVVKTVARPQAQQSDVAIFPPVGFVYPVESLESFSQPGNQTSQTYIYMPACMTLQPNTTQTIITTTIQNY